MYAIKYPHNLNKWYQQIFSSFCFPALLRQASQYVIALENPEKASSMIDKGRARAAIQRHLVNLQLFGPIINDGQKHVVKNKKKSPMRAQKMQVVPELNNKEHLADQQVPQNLQMFGPTMKRVVKNKRKGPVKAYNMEVVPELSDKEYLPDLQASELNNVESHFPENNAKKLSQVFQILKSNKQRVDNDFSQMIEGEFKESNNNRKHDKTIDIKNIRSHSSDAAKKARTGTVIKLPLYNIWKSRKEEETNIQLQTRIPKDVCLEKCTVKYILEKTSSESVRKGKRESPFGNAEKKLIEEKLRSYLAPSDVPGPDIPPALCRYWQSMKPVLQKMHNVCFNVGTTHPVLKYSTQADIICNFEKDLVVLDWTSLIGLSSSSEDIIDAVLKTIACVGALHFDPNINYEKRLCAAVLVSNGSGSPADMLVLKGDAAKTSWTKWIERFQSFYENKI